MMMMMNMVMMLKGTMVLKGDDDAEGDDGVGVPLLLQQQPLPLPQAMHVMCNLPR